MSFSSAVILYWLIYFLLLYELKKEPVLKRVRLTTIFEWVFSYLLMYTLMRDPSITEEGRRIYRIAPYTVYILGVLNFSLYMLLKYFLTSLKRYHS